MFAALLHCSRAMWSSRREPSGSARVERFRSLSRCGRRVIGSDRDGRRYTVVVRAKDNAGNQRSSSAVVTVPPSARNLRRGEALYDQSVSLRRTACRRCGRLRGTTPAGSRST